MARTAAVYAFPAALITLVWLRLEERPVAGGEWFWVVLLALLPALAPTLWLRLALVRARWAPRTVGRARHDVHR